MALGATLYRFSITLSDVDRGVYETLDLRMAQHPSESMRFLLTRLIAYALSYEEGIAFSKGGLSQTDEPPVSVRDAGGALLAWIDVGLPSAERLHKATKAAKRVALFTHVEEAQLRRIAGDKAIHDVESIEVQRLDPAFLDALEATIDRHTKLELVRNDGNLYVTVNGKVIEGRLSRVSLLSPPF